MKQLKKTFPKSGLLTTLNGNSRYIANYTLNISKMYNKEELKSEENKVQDTLNNELNKKEKINNEKQLEKWVLGLIFKPSNEYGICYFKISNLNKVTNNDAVIEILNYLNEHEDEKIFLLNNNYEFEEFNNDLKNIKLFNFNCILFGNEKDKFQYLRRMTLDEYNKLSYSLKFLYNNNINKLFTKAVYSDGSIYEWGFPSKHIGFTQEKLNKLINSYLKIINNYK